MHRAKCEQYHARTGWAGCCSGTETGYKNGDILSVQERDSAYLTVPYSGTWNVLIDSHSQSLEHSISYVPA